MTDIADLDSRRQTRHIIFWSAPVIRDGEVQSFGLARRCIDMTPDDYMIEARDNGGVKCMIDGGGYVVIPWPPACIEVKETDTPIQSGWHRMQPTD
ncbi:MAG TPA: hypothetical protein VK971_09055 [Thiohalobacter sp.]|nr:hypothetical protein [Thiohalobacter sp.]